MAYPAFFEMYRAAIKNTWTVEEVDFATDVSDLRTKLGDAERHLVQRLVAFFATGDSIVANNLVLNLCKHLNAPEARNLICFAACVEGLFFFGAFAYVYFLRSRGLLHGLAAGTSWGFRDESAHMAFAFAVVNKVREEEPELFDDTLTSEVLAMLAEAIDCETPFAEDLLGRGVVGLSVRDVRAYLEFCADQRPVTLGMPKRYGTRNPLDFMIRLARARSRQGGRRRLPGQGGGVRARPDGVLRAFARRARTGALRRAADFPRSRAARGAGLPARLRVRRRGGSSNRGQAGGP